MHLNKLDSIPSEISDFLGGRVRHDWQVEDALLLLNLPFNDLVYMAQNIHRKFFDPNEIQISSLLSIKTGACSEDCAYCPQSARYETGLTREELLSEAEVLEAARQARDQGAERFAWGLPGAAPKTVTLSGYAE